MRVFHSICPMTDPITPPPELVERLAASSRTWTEAVTDAYRAGADQELEACCEWLRKDLDAYELVGLRAVYLDHNLRVARRPKPPSLKEQALASTNAILNDPSRARPAEVRAALELNRRALEQLSDD